MPRYRMASSIRLAVCYLLFFAVDMQHGVAGPLDFSSNDTVTVTAQRAWEAEEVDVIHFSGRFELRAPDWSLFGDTAVVYGKLDNPDRVVVEGKPARISFLRETPEDADDPDSVGQVDGTAAFVEYFRATDRLYLRGSATLTRKDSTLTSEVIEYDVDADRYSTSGEGGIRIRFNPEDD